MLAPSVVWCGHTIRIRWSRVDGRRHSGVVGREGWEWQWEWEGHLME